MAVLSSSWSYSTGIWLGFRGCPQFLTIIFYRYVIESLWLPQFLRLIFYRCLIRFLWLSSLLHDHTYSTGIWLGICGCPPFLTIVFYRYLFRFLWLSSLVHDHIQQVSDWAFVAVLSSSRSYSTGIWLGFRGCPQFLTIIFYRYMIKILWLPQYFRLIFYTYLTAFVAVRSSRSYSTDIWFGFCGCPKFLRLIFYRYLTEHL